MKFHDENFNKVYDKIIDTYNKGLVSNGDDFLEYYHNQENALSLLENIKSNLNFNSNPLYRIGNYEQKYFAELFFNSIVDAYDNGLISNYEDFLEFISNREDISNYYVMTLSVIADTIEDVYYDMTSVYNSSKIDYAVGRDLDSIGEIVGCPRPQATKSAVMVTFKIGAKTDTSIPIPQGQIVVNRNGVNFVTQEDGVIPIGETECEIYCESVGTGSNTRVLSETITKIDSNLGTEGLSVINKNSSSGGRDRYTDEEYRLLLKDWVKSTVKGSREAYVKYFSTFDGLNGYKLIPNWDGSGTLKIVLDPGYPYQLQKAYDEICESVCQLPDDITMWSPTRVPVDVFCSVNVDIDQVNPYSESEKDEIRSRIIDAIMLFIDGDVLNYEGLGIGEDFVPYQLGVFISELIPEIKNVTFYESEDKYCKYKENTKDEVVQLLLAKPLTINDEEIGFCNSITVKME